MEKSISIEGQNYELLGVQKHGAGVYRGASAYARVGDMAAIEPDYQQHLLMQTAKYPVAEILGRGNAAGMEYFLEKSLGAQSFKVRFLEDMARDGKISSESFSDFLAAMRKLFTAQLKSIEGEWQVGEFAGGIQLGVLTRELPTYRDALEKRFVEACQRLKGFPRVLVHGDCDPSNVYESGFIDVEYSFFGPLGYDMTTPLTSMEWSPDTKNFEFYSQYRFTDAQRETYLTTFDKLLKKAKLPALSDQYSDFAFCRAVWLCTGMHEWPRIQQWRYEKLIETFLS